MNGDEFWVSSTIGDERRSFAFTFNTVVPEMFSKNELPIKEHEA
jgi:hypothetical protein